MEQINLWDMTEDQANSLLRNVKSQIESIVNNNKAIDLETGERKRIISELSTLNVPAMKLDMISQAAPSSGAGQDKSAATASQQTANADKARAAAAQQAAQADLNSAQASNQDANSARLAAEANTREAAASEKAAASDLKESTTSSSGAIGNFNYALYAAIGALSAFTPTIDENSTVIDYFIKNVLESANQLLILVSILESFGGIQGLIKGISSGFGLLKTSTLSAAASQKASALANKAAATSELIETGANKVSAATEGAESLASGTSAAADTTEAISGGVAATADAAEAAGSGIAATADVAESVGSTIATAGDVAEGVASSLLAGIQAALAAALAAPLAPFIALAAVIAAVVAGIYLWNKSVAEAAKKEKEKAIEKGDVAQTRKSAEQEYNANASNTAFLGTLASGLIIGIGPGLIVGLTTLILGAIFPEFNEGINVLFGGKTKNSVLEMANAQSRAAKTAKAVEQANKDVAQAMQQFENGTISAAGVLAASNSAIQAATEQRLQAEKAATENEKNKSTGGFAIARNIVGILPGIQNAEQRNAQIDKENEELSAEAKKGEASALESAQPGLQLIQKQVAASGGSFEDFLAIVKNINPQLAKILQETGTNDLIQSFENLSKEAERTRKAFEAMNLGFQNVQAVSGALSVSMQNLLSKQEAGYIPLENSIRLLEASITNAAQGIGDNDFDSALRDSSQALKNLGASDAQIQKFKENLTAINTAQKYFAQISEETKNNLINEFKRGGGGPAGAEGQREFFAKTLNEQLAKAGIGEEVRNRISAAIEGGELNQDDIESILGGNLEALDKVLKDLGEKTLSQLIGPLQELAKYEGQLVQITKQRLELENKVVESQRNVLEAQLEAAEIIAKYGGKAVTPEDRRQNVIAQANVQTVGTGVGKLRTGSAAELNQRNQQIRTRLQEISNIRSRAAQGEEGLAGQQGAKLEAEEKRLQELAKSDYNTTKNLIKLKEEELKLIAEKNKLEKDSIDALIGGDIDKFFQLQQAQGAKAAIATGNVALQQAYGPAALGIAAQDIQRQQEAGVQTLFGQQLGGAGGLTERAFGTALGSRGIQDARMAQIAAGTTVEEEMARSDIRALAETLPNYAETQLQVAEQELVAANVQMQAAEAQLQAARQNVEARANPPAAAAAKNRGGIVYANRGIFIPRGTDTVPAMLTPGEFVVRREAVQRGNNLQILQAMNRSSSSAPSSTGVAAMAQGGIVRYRENGSNGPETGQATSNYSDLIQALGKFNSDFSSNIDRLSRTNFMVKLDPTNINVNFTGASFLEKLTNDLKKEIAKEVISEIKNKYSVGDGGRIQDNPRVL
jgi:hypothetical protein